MTREIISLKSPYILCISEPLSIIGAFSKLDRVPRIEDKTAELVKYLENALFLF